MINQTIKDRMDQLYEQLNLYNYQYYVLDSPTIEDTEYDSLIRELEELEKAYPEFAREVSPTKQVGSYINTSL